MRAAGPRSRHNNESGANGRRSTRQRAERLLAMKTSSAQSRIATTPASLPLPSPNDAMREFHFSDADFRGLVELAYQYAGIALADSKRNLVYSRLSRRLRALGFRTFAEYRTYLDETDAERENFIN